MALPDRSPALQRIGTPIIAGVVALAVSLAIPGGSTTSAVIIAVVVALGIAWANRRARARASAPQPMDPFTISEPWRQFVQAALRSRQRLTATVEATRAGPIRDRLTGITDRLDRAIEQSWGIARRGDEIDAAVSRIDPVRLRAQLDVLSGGTSEDHDSAQASIESQLASADRLKALSASTIDRLLLSQARLDELVARASEVSVGTTDSDTYEHDVDDLVIELEGLRQAVAETNEAG
ncbi:hypothetical protein BH24ACT5_BH24ACT5_23730 [soil metagenome]